MAKGAGLSRLATAFTVAVVANKFKQNALLRNLIDDFPSLLNSPFTEVRGPNFKFEPCNGRSAKLEHFSRQHWRGEKPKPSYLHGPSRVRSLLCSRLFLLLTAFALSVTAIFFVTVYVHKRPHNGEDIVDIPKATRKYNGYLASPEHRALVYPDQDDRARGNAAIIALVRNSELREMSQSMRELEETFNQKFRYPWIFFNDEPFDDKFKRMTSSLTDAETFYEVIPKEHWDVPKWIHPDLMQAAFDKLDSQGVQYAKMLSYHKMCRWNSGLFFHHPALANYTWYWRVEPNVHFFCDIEYDVFRFMELNDKTYGFVINIYDSPQSIPSLWPTTEEYLALHPDAIHPNSAIEWLTDSTRRPGHHRDANGYSTCHFWSNFEIGNLNFWRGERYQTFFDYLDRQGGFFYERWGDAPVHSIGLGLFEDKKKIHWFHDIGYNHIPYLNCPASKKCRGCDAGKFFDGVGLHAENCKPLWDKVMKLGPGQKLKHWGPDR